MEAEAAVERSEDGREGRREARRDGLFPPAGAQYFVWSRDLAVGVFGVLPLWLLYEALRLSLAPEERNGAEALVTDAMALFGPHAQNIMRATFFALVALAAISLLRRQVPWLRVAMVSAGEGLVYGVLLGPATGALTLEFVDTVALQSAGLSVGQEPVQVFGTAVPLAADLVGSLGAGIFEETVFRLLLLSVLAFCFGRVCESFAMPTLLGVAAAVVTSALAFSWFHHIGPGGEPLELEVFVFRAIAGLLLGVLFVARGFAVCVYTHAAYDVLYYLNDAALSAAEYRGYGG